MLNNGAKWYNFSPPRWSIIAPPLTRIANCRCRLSIQEFLLFRNLVAIHSDQVSDILTLEPLHMTVA